MSSEPTTFVTITARARGPLVIEGNVIIRSPEGQILEAPPSKTPGVIKLCACGRTRNRPFCDGTHKIDPEQG